MSTKRKRHAPSSITNKTIVMRKTVIMVLLLCFALPMMAQNKKKEERIQLARDRYAAGLENISINKQYEQDEIPAVNYTSVVRKQNWAGGGQSVD